MDKLRNHVITSIGPVVTWMLGIGVYISGVNKIAYCAVRCRVAANNQEMQESNPQLLHSRDSHIKLYNRFSTPFIGPRGTWERAQRGSTLLPKFDDFSRGRIYEQSRTLW